jgi:hypothetical protein
VRQQILKFRQHDEGLCGLYTIVNALSILFPEHMTHLKGTVLVERLAEAIPGDFGSVIREGTDRGQMGLMLAAAQRWTKEEHWPEWTCRPMHPEHGQKAQPFWDRLAAEISGGKGRGGKKKGRSKTRAALIGFGDYHRESTYYEPHWTCVERITPLMLFLRDSDEYRRIPRGETGIRPEDGWEIEDCFILERPASPA